MTFEIEIYKFNMQGLIKELYIPYIGNIKEKNGIGDKKKIYIF